MKEFTTEEGYGEVLSTHQDANRSFDFEAYFELPETTRDVRRDMPFKTIRTEYLLMSQMLLVGNVGGTLGVFIGFSIFGTSEWFIGVFTKLWTCFKNTRNLRTARSPVGAIEA